MPACGVMANGMVVAGVQPARIPASPGHAPIEGSRLPASGQQPSSWEWLLPMIDEEEEPMVPPDPPDPEELPDSYENRRGV